MNNIVAYSDYYKDVYEYTKKGNIPNIKTQENKKPNDINKFFATRGLCPFCQKDIKIVFKGARSSTMGTDLYQSIDIWECNYCSWWECSTEFRDEIDSVDEVYSVHTDAYYYAIAKKFKIDDKKLPLNVLLNELQKNKQLLYEINPYKLEELAQSVLSDFFSCNVNHVGKTGDGGIDLILVESDDPILIQVKRRQNHNHVELVKGVREFVGTILIEDCRKGIYLTTAKEFSRGAKKLADNLLENRKLDYFELIDYDKFTSMLNLKKDENKYWMELARGYSKL